MYPVRARFVAIEGTLTWAWTVVAMEIVVDEIEGGRVAVAATVQYHDDEDSDEPAWTITCQMTGVCRSRSATAMSIQIDQPAPISRLVLDPSQPVVDYMFASSESTKRKPLPSFWTPLLDWATANGRTWHMPLGWRRFAGARSEHVGRVLANGRFEIIDWIGADFLMGVAIARDVQRGERIRLTFAGDVARSAADLEGILTPAVDGLAPVVYLGETAGEDGWGAGSMMLAEELPPVDPLDLEKPASSAEQVARFGARLAGVVSRVHRAGTVLGTIRPESTFVESDGHITLAARGERLWCMPRPNMTKPAMAAPWRGGYRAPETMMRIDAMWNHPHPSADVFSLGVMLASWHLGRFVYPETDDFAVFQSQLEGRHLPLPDTDLGQVLARCLRPDPAARPRSKSSSGLCRRRPAHADDAFLCGTRDEAAAPIEELTAHEASAAGGRRAVDDVEEPVVDPERPVEPHHVVDRGDLHARHEPARTVRVHRCAEEREVRRVGEQVAMERRIVGQRVDRAVPHAAVRRRGDRVQRIANLDGTDLDRALGGGDRAERRRQLIGDREREIELGPQRFRRRDLGHRVLVIEALLDTLKRCFEAEDRLAVLDGGDAPGGEARAVAQPVDLIEDRAADVAGAHEVSVQRMDGPVGGDGLGCCRCRLAEHLAAEDRAPAEVLAAPAKQIAIQSLETEEIDECGEDGLHGRVGTTRELSGVSRAADAAAADAAVPGFAAAPDG